MPDAATELVDPLATNRGVVTGDCAVVLPTLPSNSFSACITDPPYEIGFMGTDWDRRGDAFRVAVWREVLRVLKPGAFLIAFGGARTYHRMTCAIEDAGFEIRDCIMWLYGSGVPKSNSAHLKPAYEPIVVARVPVVGNLQLNRAAHGTGALNIDGCRVAFESVADERKSKAKNQHANFESGGRINRNIFHEVKSLRGNYDAPGRWPANVVHDGCDDVLRTFPCVGDTAGASAARFFYCAKASTAERNAGLVGVNNTHSTVKPLALMQWLTRLVTPSGGIVLDPFSGSGTTGVACVREGFGFVGIEREANFAEIARARIAAEVQAALRDALQCG